MNGKTWVTQSAFAVAVLATACAGGPGAEPVRRPARRRRSIRSPAWCAAPTLPDGQITVAHEAIPDLMDGMTMTFAVKEAWAAQVAQPGDRLSATLVVDGARSWIQGVSLSKPAVR